MPNSPTRNMMLARALRAKPGADSMAQGIPPGMAGGRNPVPPHKPQMAPQQLQMAPQQPQMPPMPQQGGMPPSGREDY